MDITQIESWLKRTIPGLVFLGAVGSLVAALIIRLSRPLVRFLQHRLLSAHVALHIKAVARENWILGSLSSRDDPSFIAMHVLYQAFKFFFLVSTAPVAITVLSFRLSLPSHVY